MSFCIGIHSQFLPKVLLSLVRSQRRQPPRDLVKDAGAPRARGLRQEAWSARLKVMISLETTRPLSIVVKNFFLILPYLVSALQDFLRQIGGYVFLYGKL